MKESIKYPCQENNGGWMMITNFQDGTAPVIETYAHDFRVGACLVPTKEDLREIISKLHEAYVQMED